MTGQTETARVFLLLNWSLSDIGLKIKSRKDKTCFKNKRTVHARIRVELAWKSKCQIGCLVKAYAIHFLFSSNACPSDRCICWCQVKICVKGFCHDKTHN